MGIAGNIFLVIEADEWMPSNLPVDGQDQNKKDGGDKIRAYTAGNPEMPKQMIVSRIFHGAGLYRWGDLHNK
jgi:hypothetical protein